MKEIKEFVDMMERDARILTHELKDCQRHLVSYNFGELEAYNGIMQTETYQALKSLVNAPVTKVEVTDEMCDIVDKIVIERGGVTNKATARIALEAIFSMQEPKDIFDSFPPESPLLDEPENELVSDRWITWFGGECPVNNKTPIEVRYRNRPKDNTFNIAEAFFWGCDEDDSDIIAYRIISEPEEKKEPEKQTFEEWAIRNTPYGNLDALTPGEIICLISEWERTK